MMEKKNKIGEKPGVPHPEIPSEIKQPVDPQEPLEEAVEDPDIIPDEEEEKEKPAEPPAPGEGP